MPRGGDHTLQLTCGSVTRDLTLTVTNTQHKTVELPAEEDVGGAEEPQRHLAAVHQQHRTKSCGTGCSWPHSSAIAVHYGDIQMRDGQRSGNPPG